LTRPS